MQRLVRDLNARTRSTGALRARRRGAWVHLDRRERLAQSVASFIRYPRHPSERERLAKGRPRKPTPPRRRSAAFHVIFIGNFTPVARSRYGSACRGALRTSSFSTPTQRNTRRGDGESRAAWRSTTCRATASLNPSSSSFRRSPRSGSCPKSKTRTSDRGADPAAFPSACSAQGLGSFSASHAERFGASAQGDRAAARSQELCQRRPLIFAELGANRDGVAAPSRSRREGGYPARRGRDTTTFRRPDLCRVLARVGADRSVVRGACVPALEPEDAGE